MNLIDMYNVVKQATDRVREAKTYRYKGHSMSDPATYRSKEELLAYKNKDPIESIKNLIVEKKYATEEGLKNIEKKVKGIIQEAVEFAKSSVEPSKEELYNDVYIY